MPAVFKKGNIRLIILSILLFIGLLITYWNHFDNPFHFDDFHTIVNNPYVKDLNNIPDFFTDHNRTQSTRPVVKTYRPVVTTFNALSYSLTRSYKPFSFHLITFALYLLQLFLMFLLYQHLLKRNFHKNLVSFIALFGVAWYAFHAANAETINYIIARSDSISAMFVTMALVIWIDFPRYRKYGLYLIPAVLGLLTKEQAAMFIPVLFFYILLFEHKMSLYEIFKNEGLKQILVVLKKILPALIILLALTTYIVFFIRVPKEPSYGYSSVQYALTQPYVWLHYFISFLFPYNLSVDPDMKIIRGISDIRFWIGIGFICALVFTIFKTSIHYRWRPVSFGLIWFGLALIPTSSIFTLGQITNDHRMFFPFIGLTLSAASSLGLLYKLIKSKLHNIWFLRLGVIVFLLSILIIHALATNQRNKIWDSDSELWKEAINKNPENARALMNYGLALMKKNQYHEAKGLYLQAYKITPNYDYLMVNLGVIYQKLNLKDSAQYFFKKALRISPDVHFVNYYYGLYLFKQNKLKQARNHAIKAIQCKNNYLNARYLLMDIYFRQNKFKKLQSMAEETLKIDRYDKVASLYINEIKNNNKNIDRLEKTLRNFADINVYKELSLAYYRNEEYKRSIEVCLNGLKLNKSQTELYNNIGSAYIALGKYEAAIPYLEKAVFLDSSFERAKNNLKIAKSELEMNTLINKNYSYNQWINLSLEYYKKQKYDNCIICCEKALEINPNSAVAYNNICSAYNQMQEYDKAQIFCKKALEINPKMLRAQNNLKITQTHK